MMAALVEHPRQRSDYDLTGEYGALAVPRGLADAKWYASPIPKDKMRALLERRNGPAVRDTIIWFALFIGFAAAAIALWGTWWAIIPLALYGILYATSGDSRWHECGHGTAFKTDWMNNVMYEIGSFMDTRESVPWRWSHARHHSDTIIVGRDPEAPPRPVSPALTIGSFFNMPIFLIHLRTICLHAAGRMTPTERTYVPETAFRSTYWHARVYLVIYLGTVAAAIALRSFLPLLFVGLPSIYGRWLLMIYATPQHAGLAENVLDHRLNTRTVYMDPISRYLYWNMFYHVEHHMFPMVPYYNLPRLHALMVADCPPPYRNLLEAWREIAPALIREVKDGDDYVRRPLPAPSTVAETTRSVDIIESDAQPDAAGWVDVCDLERLLPDDMLRFDHAGKAYAVYRTFIGQLFASDNLCPHGRGELSNGLLMGTVIECPKHNGRFDIRDGSVRRPPPQDSLRMYRARERDGKVQINVNPRPAADQAK
jgi:fatty acid desaturase/nitrite reductase/ring-hydroxylating ferredoxin subunit